MANFEQLGDRIKRDFEDALRIRLPRRTNVVIRIDGKGFHTFTKKLPRPYYQPLADAMDAAALELCREITGCCFAYGQSDEYSFLVTDTATKHSRLWFDGNLQKITSVSASIFTGAFANAFFALPSGADGELAPVMHRIEGQADSPGRVRTPGRAAFDARVLLIPQVEDVVDYFRWRQLDAEANSLNMLASAHYSHAELLGKSTQEKHELLHAKGVNWAKMPTDFKRGRAVTRIQGHWQIDRNVPIFSRQPGYLKSTLPA